MRRWSDRLALAAIPAVLFATAAGAQEWRSVTTARQLQGESALRVQVRYGAGDLRLGATSGGLLYRMQLRHDERRTRPLSEYDRDAGVVRLGVEGTSRGQRGGRSGGEAVIGLAPSVSLDLRLEFGAGQAAVELGGMAVRRLEVATGASETDIRWTSPNRVDAEEVRLASGASRLRVSGLGNARAERVRYEGGVGEAVLEFDGDWRGHPEVSVEMGLGTVTLRFPRSLGVRLESRSTLARFSPAGMERRGDAWFSPGYEAARQRVVVRVGAALGAVHVQWID
jgi:hypothetical protein